MIECCAQLNCNTMDWECDPTKMLNVAMHNLMRIQKFCFYFDYRKRSNPLDQESSLTLAKALKSEAQD